MTTDPTLLQERIARALYENAEYYGPEPTQPHWDSRDGEERGEWMKVAAAVLPIVAAEVRKAKAEALRAWASGVESQLDATASEGIALGEWGRGLRSGVQQARDTADRFETGASDEHR